MKRFGGGSSDWPRVVESVWPAHAECAILASLAAFEAKAATPEQFCDLADAIDAFVEGKFYVAKVLAEAASHRRTLERAKRQPVRRTLSELRAAFLAGKLRHYSFSSETE